MIRPFRVNFVIGKVDAERAFVTMPVGLVALRMFSPTAIADFLACRPLVEPRGGGGTNQEANLC